MYSLGMSCDKYWGSKVVKGSVGSISWCNMDRLPTRIFAAAAASLAAAAASLAAAAAALAATTFILALQWTSERNGSHVSCKKNLQALGMKERYPNVCKALFGTQCSRQTQLRLQLLLQLSH